LPDATNTIYIAPGTYRGTVTMSITPSVSNTLVVAGDPTAAQFSGVNAGRVRITTYVTDNTIPTAGQTFTCDSKTYFTIRNLHIEGYVTASVTGIAHFLNSKNYTVEKCLFSIYRRGGQSSCVIANTTTTTSISAIFDKCVFVGGYTGITIQSPLTGSAFNLDVTIKDTIFNYGQYISIIAGTGDAAAVGNGVTFYNNILNGTATIYLRSTNTTNKTSFYNNAICAFNGIGLDVSANTAVEDYNRFSCATDRSGTITTGANSQSGVFGVDFNYSRISGLYPLDFNATYSGSQAQNTGTPSGAPTVDIFGDTWSMSNPDVGAATFKLSSATSQYYPTERNASAITIAPGSTSQSIELYLGATGLTFSTSGLAAYYVRNKSAPVAITLITQTATGAWSSGGFAEISSSLVPGVYRLDVPNAAFAAGASDVTIVVRGASGTNGAVLTVTLSSGGLTAAQTAAAVFDAVASSYTTAGSMGARLLKTTVDNRPADVGTSNHIQANVHAIVDSTAAASELSGALLHNGTDYISAELVTPVTQSALVRMGPYQVIADGVATPMPLDIQKGAQHGVDIQCVDNNLSAIDITGATITAKVYNSGGTLVATYSGTATYAADGRAQFTITTTVTNTPGTYTATITRTTGASDTQVFGPLRIYVRDI
jgi:hypothetical protein